MSQENPNPIEVLVLLQNSPIVFLILWFLKKKGKARLSQIAYYLNRSNQFAQNYLIRLEKRGLVKREKENENRYWLITEKGEQLLNYLKEIHETLRGKQLERTEKLVEGVEEK